MAKVLIVDDSSTQREALRALVQGLGHVAIVAANGEEGVRRAIEETPDLILMDVVMPGAVNGYQATRQLTREPTTAIIPIVLITSKDQPTDEVWGRRQGARDYLTKPVDEKALIAVIDRLVNHVDNLRRDLQARDDVKRR